MSKRRALPSKMDKDGFNESPSPAPKPERPKVVDAPKPTAPPKVKRNEATLQRIEANPTAPSTERSGPSIQRSETPAPTKNAPATPGHIQALRASLELAETQGNKTLAKTLKKALQDLERDKRERISLSLPESKIEELRNLHALEGGPATLSGVVEEAIDWLLKKGRKAHGGEIPARPDAGKPLARGPRGQR